MIGLCWQSNFIHARYIHWTYVINKADFFITADMYFALQKMV